MTKVSLLLACYLRPASTIEAVESVFAQDTNGIELLFYGDGCRYWQALVDSEDYTTKRDEFIAKGNTVVEKQFTHGGVTPLVTHAIENAKGKYLLFMGNDDLLRTNHCSLRYEAAGAAEADLVFFDILQETAGSPIETVPTELRMDGFGHGNIIVRASVARSQEEHNESYGHDYYWVANMQKNGATLAVCNAPPTYLQRLPPKGTHRAWNSYDPVLGKDANEDGDYEGWNK